MLLDGLSYNDLVDIANPDSSPDENIHDCGTNERFEDKINGVLVCGCGQILDEIVDVDGERHYNDDGGNARCGTTQNPLLPQSSLGTMVGAVVGKMRKICLLYTSPSPRDGLLSRMPSSA